MQRNRNDSEKIKKDMEERYRDTNVNKEFQKEEMEEKQLRDSEYRIPLEFCSVFQDFISCLGDA